MLDTIGFLDNNLEVRFFYCSNNQSSVHQQIWTKPRGAKLIYIFLLGGGGGGGGGFTGIAGTARGGGGGGGSGSVVSGTFLACTLPDTLSVVVASGAIGGAVNTAGSNGTQSIVFIYSDPTALTAHRLLTSNAGQGGGAGTAAAAGSAGVAGGATSIVNMPFGILGNFVATAGVAGAAGGVQTGAVGGSVTALSSQIVTGGAGGGGVGTANTNNAGGNITGSGVIPTITGGIAASGAGSPGCFIRKPFCACGGSGGGTAGASGVAGAGGNAMFGSGGGGGGGGVTAGIGGKGGDGIAIIITVF